MEIKKINAWSLARITTIFGLILGIVSVILLAIANKSLESIPLEELQQSGITNIEFTWKTAVFTIVSYTLVGFVWGFLIALIYNVLAKYIGGIVLDVKEKKGQ